MLFICSNQIASSYNEAIEHRRPFIVPPPNSDESKHYPTTVMNFFFLKGTGMEMLPKITIQSKQKKYQDLTTLYRHMLRLSFFRTHSPSLSSSQIRCPLSLSLAEPSSTPTSLEPDRNPTRILSPYFASSGTKIP
jgi:hypothetical protein